MGLAEDQRDWLQNALQYKGRFTLDATIKSEWEEYVRRRQKAADALQGLAFKKSEKAQAGELAELKEALEDADDVAKTGKFKTAYKHLEDVKRRAKALRGNFEIDLQSLKIDDKLSELEAKFDELDRTFQDGISQVNIILERAKNEEKAQDQKDLTEALRFKVQFEATSALFLEADFESGSSILSKCASIARAFTEQLDACDNIIKKYEALGRTEATTLRDRWNRAVARHAGPGEKFATAKKIFAIRSEREKEFKAAMHDIRDLGHLQPREGEGVTVDRPTRRIRRQVLIGAKGLTEEQKTLATAADVAKGRMERAVKRFDKDDLRDALSLLRTPKPRGQRAEQEMFDPAVELNDLAGDALYIDKDIGRDQADQIVATAAAKMLAFVQNAESGSSELLDLMLKFPSDYATMIGEQLTGSSDETAWSPAQAECIKATAKTLFETVCRNTKDAVSGDGKTMTFAGKTYSFDRELGSGVTSTAYKFIDPATNEAVVVKKMNVPRPEDRNEVLLHDRLMRGKEQGSESGSHIVEMKGMCLDADGGRYIVMEALEGGELGQAGNNLSAMTSSGSLPEEARIILASDMIGQLASGLLELERQGVLHGDMKGANVMLTADGKVKVIDFGTSRELGPEESTGGNAASISYLLEQLISEVAPSSLEDTRPLAGIGSMGKIMAEVNNPVKSLRPSMESILACSMFKRGGQDFPEEDIKDLKVAASDYSMRLGKVEVPFDPADYKAKTGAQLKKGIAERLQAGKPVDVAVLAQEIGFIDTSIGAAFRDARNGKEINMSVVTEHNKTKAYFNSLIQKSVAAQEAKGKDAFDHLTKPPEKPDPRAPKDPEKEASEAARVKNNPTIQMDGPQGQETILLIDAKARQDRITEVINAMTKDFYDKMNSGEKFDAADIEMIDAQIEILKTQFAALQKALFDALGADAQFYLSKQKLEDVGRRFGTPKAVTPQPEIERDKLEENLAYLNKLAEVREVNKNAAG